MKLIFIIIFLINLKINNLNCKKVTTYEGNNEQSWMKSFSQDCDNLIEIETAGKINNYRLSSGSFHQDCIYSTDHYSLDLSKLENKDFTKLFYPQMIHFSLCGPSKICEKLTSINGTSICMDLEPINNVNDIVNIKVNEDDIDLQVEIISTTTKKKTTMNFYCSNLKDLYPQVEKESNTGNLIITLYTPFACPSPLITSEKDQNKYYSYDNKEINDKRIARFELYENSTNVISFNDNAHFVILPLKPIINRVLMNDEKDKIIFKGLFLKRIKNHYAIRINNGTLVSLADTKPLLLFNSSTIILDKSINNGTDSVREVSFYLSGISSDSYLFVNNTQWISIGSPQPLPFIKDTSRSYIGTFISYFNIFSYF